MKRHEEAGKSAPGLLPEWTEFYIRLLFVAIVLNTVLNLPLLAYESAFNILWVGWLNDIAGILVIWLLLCSLAVLTKRAPYVVFSILSFAVVSAFINLTKIRTLGEPIALSDAHFLAKPELYGGAVELWIYVALFATIILFGYLAWLTHRRGWWAVPSLKSRMHERFRSIVAVVAFVSVSLSLLSFSSSYSPAPAVFDALSFGKSGWSKLDDMRLNGVLSTLVLDGSRVPMVAPEGFSEDRLDLVANELQTEWPAGEKSNREVLPNIVIVLSESFADPSVLNGLHLHEDPIALYRHRESEGQAGTIVPNAFGTGTSNMEFEVLTGLSTGLFDSSVQSAYMSVVDKQKTFPSVVGWLKHSGYKAIAIHPYSPEVYQRKAVYQALGFDDFRHELNMAELTSIDGGTYVSDDRAFKEVLNDLSQSREPVLANVVTMQNHFPMPRYSAGPIEAKGDLAKSSLKQIGLWARGLSYSAQALDAFLSELERLDEPTVVVYYGDHFPGIMSRNEYVPRTGLASLATPAMIWANIDIQHESRFTFASPTTLVPRALKSLGYDVPPFYEFLMRVEEEVGTISENWVTTADGNIVDHKSLSAEQRQLIDQYRLIQYDFSMNEGWTLDRLWYDWKL